MLITCTIIGLCKWADMLLIHRHLFVCLVFHYYLFHIYSLFDDFLARSYSFVFVFVRTLRSSFLIGDL